MCLTYSWLTPRVTWTHYKTLPKWFNWVQWRLSMTPRDCKCWVSWRSKKPDVKRHNPPQRPSGKGSGNRPIGSMEPSPTLLSSLNKPCWSEPRGMDSCDHLIPAAPQGFTFKKLRFRRESKLFNNIPGSDGNSRVSSLNSLQLVARFWVFFFWGRGQANYHKPTEMKIGGFHSKINRSRTLSFQLDRSTVVRSLQEYQEQAPSRETHPRISRYLRRVYKEATHYRTTISVLQIILA